jgi:outer membrane protein TolC
MRQGVRNLALLAVTAALGGCAAFDSALPVPLYPSANSTNQGVRPRGSVTPQLPTGVKPVARDATPIQLTAATEPNPPRTRPAYALEETLPIDLPTVIRLVDRNSPAVGFAQAKVREAQARLDRADLQWLPNFALGTSYNRFDGQTQNQNGDVFGASRANLLAGGGPALSVDVADAIYRPLIERQLTAAEQSRASATVNASELDAVLAYIDLVQATAQLAINADVLEKAEGMLQAAKNAQEAKLDRYAGDVNRAQTEVYFRQQERLDVVGRIGAASARLGKLLLLPPTVRLVPAETTAVPVTLIDPTTSLDDLVRLALANRPELAANRSEVTAAWERVRRAEKEPRLPKVGLYNSTDGFGGGINGFVGQFSSRNVLSLQLYWEVKNLGFGNRADVAEQRAGVDQAAFLLADTQARIAADIVEAAQIAAARFESLEIAEKAVKEALEVYRISRESVSNLVDARNLFDALRPLVAIQSLSQARLQYLAAIADYNRAQYRLFQAIGYAPGRAVESTAK